MSKVIDSIVRQYAWNFEQTLKTMTAREMRDYVVKETGEVPESSLASKIKVFNECVQIMNRHYTNKARNELYSYMPPEASSKRLVRKFRKEFIGVKLPGSFWWTRKAHYLRTVDLFDAFVYASIDRHRGMVYSMFDGMTAKQIQDEYYRTTSHVLELDPRNKQLLMSKVYDSIDQMLARKTRKGIVDYRVLKVMSESGLRDKVRADLNKRLEAHPDLILNQAVYYYGQENWLIWCAKEFK